MTSLSAPFGGERLPPGQLAEALEALAGALSADADWNGCLVPGALVYRDGALAGVVTEPTDDPEAWAPYRPPEVARGGAPDSAALVYTLAAVGHAHLAGAPPYGGSSANAIAIAQLLEPARATDALREALGAEGAATWVAALSRNPEQRPSAARLFEVLRSVSATPIAGLAASASRIAAAGGAPPRIDLPPASAATASAAIPSAAPARRSGGLFVALAAIAFVALMVAAGLALLSSSAEAPMTSAPTPAAEPALPEDVAAIEAPAEAEEEKWRGVAPVPELSSDRSGALEPPSIGGLETAGKGAGGIGSLGVDPRHRKAGGKAAKASRTASEMERGPSRRAKGATAKKARTEAPPPPAQNEPPGPGGGGIAPDQEAQAPEPEAQPAAAGEPAISVVEVESGPSPAVILALVAAFALALAGVGLGLERSARLRLVTAQEKSAPAEALFERAATRPAPPARTPLPFPPELGVPASGVAGATVGLRPPTKPASGPDDPTELAPQRPPRIATREEDSPTLMDLGGVQPTGFADTLPSVPRIEPAPELANIEPIVIAQYECFARIGAGGMGQVYKARHQHLDRISAVKVLLPHTAASKDAVEMFKREARLAASIDHPNTVSIYDFGELEPSLFYLAMEFIDGPTLQELISPRGKPPSPLPLARTLTIARQIGEALQAAHDKGIVHRDLKPQNVMLTKRHGRDVVKVVDFGIARALSAPSEGEGGALVGTPAFMSPEQAMGAADVDARSDVFSMGLVIYTMLTGKLPASGTTPIEQVIGRARMKMPPPRLRDAAPTLGIPSEVDDALQRALEPDRARRTPSAVALVESLEHAARSPALRV